MNQLQANIVCSKSVGGTPNELRRTLSVAERQGLTQRMNLLAQWLQPGRQADMQEAVATMMMNLSKRSLSAEQALDIAAEWAHVLRDLPGWAIFRACHRFETGRVVPADLGVDKFDPAWEPNTAQLSRIARQIAAPTWAEHDTIKAILASPIRGAPVETDRGPNSAAAQHMRGMEIAEETRRSERLERQQRDSAQNLQTRLAQRQAEYERAGLKPPEPKAGIIVSLAMMLGAGYTIEEVDNEKVLVAPPVKQQPIPKEAVLDDEMPF